MTYYPDFSNPKVIERFRKAGRGSGGGAAYQPWYQVFDVPSRGRSHQVEGLLTGRVHHLLSDLEFGWFLMADRSRLVRDIKEQYPLFELEETLDLANRCGIKHPTNPRTGLPIVVTTDLVLAVERGGRVDTYAFALKYAHQLKRRELEKLEIERQYWARRKVDWRIGTERELPRVLVKNLENLHEAAHVDSYWSDDPDIFRTACHVLTNMVGASSDTLAQVALACDRRLGLAPGMSLRIAHHLIATHQWTIDLTVPFTPGQPLVLLGAALRAEHVHVEEGEGSHGSRGQYPDSVAG